MRLLVIAILVFSVFVAASAQDKPGPRKPTAAEKRALAKERKEKLRERKERAKANADKHEELSKNLKEGLEGWKEKLSGCVLVAKDGEVIFKQGYGLADRQARRENSPETIYDACTITMVFTAVATLKLETEGKLKLSDRLDKHLKYATGDIAGCTIEQLLTHTSGVGGDSKTELRDMHDRDAVMKDQFTAPMVSKPGEGVNFSTTNYVILAAVIDVVTGSYDNYVKKSVLDPCGMKDSASTDSGKLASKRGAKRYGEADDALDVVGFRNNWTLRGRSCTATTVEDVWRFNEAIDWSDLLDPHLKDVLFKGVSKYECMGFHIVQNEKLGAGYYINGSSIGSRSYYARYPDQDLMFVILLNDLYKGQRVEDEVANDICTAIIQGG